MAMPRWPPLQKLVRSQIRSARPAAARDGASWTEHDVAVQHVTVPSGLSTHTVLEANSVWDGPTAAAVPDTATAPNKRPMVAAMMRPGFLIRFIDFPKRELSL